MMFYLDQHKKGILNKMTKTIYDLDQDEFLTDWYDEQKGDKID